MLEYDRIDISKGIDVNKKNASKNCDIWHYWYFKDNFLKCEPYLCNGWHDLKQKAMSFNDAAIVYIKESAYWISFWYMSKDDAITVMSNSNLVDKKCVFYQYIKIWMNVTLMKKLFIKKTEMWY